MNQMCIYTPFTLKYTSDSQDCVVGLQAIATNSEILPKLQSKSEAAIDLNMN